MIAKTQISMKCSSRNQTETSTLHSHTYVRVNYGLNQYGPVKSEQVGGTQQLLALIYKIYDLKNLPAGTTALLQTVLYHLSMIYFMFILPFLSDDYQSSAHLGGKMLH